MAMKGFMARGERATENASESEPLRAVPASAPAVRTVAPSTSVDASSEFHGKLRCRDTLRIDGHVKGEVECEKAVVVGEGAKVHASISADEVQVAGLVKGNIAARRKITLEHTAIVTGNLTTPGIVIEEGAKVKGQIVIGSEEEPALDAEPGKNGKKSPASKKLAAASPKSDETRVPQPASA
jgi:cytoskeletal protein CcmA (bactofilin family)